MYDVEGLGGVVALDHARDAGERRRCQRPRQREGGRGTGGGGITYLISDAP